MRKPIKPNEVSIRAPFDPLDLMDAINQSLRREWTIGELRNGRAWNPKQIRVDRAILQALSEAYQKVGWEVEIRGSEGTWWLNFRFKQDHFESLNLPEPANP